MRGRRVHGWWLAVTLAGCAAPPLVPLQADSVFVQLRSTPPLSLTAAVARPEYHLAAPEGHAGHFPWVADALQQATADALAAAGVLTRVRPLLADLPTAEARQQAAWEAADDLLVETEVTRLEVAYRGRNGWYWPNVLLWMNLIWPAWLVPDEDYEVRIEARVRCTAVATGRPVWGGPVRTRVWRRLTDFERGMVFFALLRVPAALDETNWRSVATALGPTAQRAFQRDLAREVSAGLRRAASTPQFRRATRQTLVLAVGCGSYFDRDLTNLKLPAADADSIAAWAQRAGVPRRQIRVLRDAQATRGAVVEALRTFLVARARPNDRVIVFFAGYAGPDGRDGVAWYPYDAQVASPEQSTLGLAAIRTELESVRAEQVLVLVDAGLGGERAARWAGSGTPDAAVLAAEFAAWGRRPGRALLWACAPGEGAFEAGRRRNGLLTLAWIRSVERGAEAGGPSLALGRVFDAVRETVQTHALLSRRKQDPELHGDTGARDLVLPHEREVGR